MMFLALVVTAFVVVVVYVVSHHVLKTFTPFGPAHLLAAIVALLSGLGLLSLGDGVVMVILLPYAALGIILLLLPLLKWLLQRNRGGDLEHQFQDQPPGPLRWRNGGTGPSRKTKIPISAHVRETSRSRE